MYIYTYMGTKTISIMDEAYEALLKEKITGESFTDVIIRLAERCGRLTDSAGKWDMNDKEWGKINKELKDAWKKWGEKYK